MKLQGDLKSAENYEQSQCRFEGNQELADKLDRLSNILVSAQNRLLFSRIAIQHLDCAAEFWHDLGHLQEMMTGILTTCEQIERGVARQLPADERICPTDYMN